MPFFINHCEHSKFIMSFICANKSYDAYQTDDGGICMRDGNELEDYASYPSYVLDIIKNEPNCPLELSIVLTTLKMLKL